MRHFIANVIAMFIPVRKTRSRVRNKIRNMTTKRQRVKQEQKYLQLKSDWLKHNNGQLLLPGRFSEYDFIFAIGATCHISWFLDAFGLRQFSSPLEWTGGKEPSNWYIDPSVERSSRFREKIDAICNGFSDFLSPENYKQVSDWNLHKEHHNVVNVKNNIRFWHAFPIGQSLESYMPDFMRKINRRADKMQKMLQSSNKILICWAHRTWDQKDVMDAIISDIDIKYAIKKLKRKYPNKIFDFVFFEHDGTKNKFQFDKICVAPGAFRIKSNHFLTDTEYDFIYTYTDVNHSHTHVISEMLDNIKLRQKATNHNTDIDF